MNQQLLFPPEQELGLIGQLGQRYPETADFPSFLISNWQENNLTKLTELLIKNIPAIGEATKFMTESIVSGILAEIATKNLASLQYSLLGPNVSKNEVVKASQEGIRFSLKGIKRDAFYIVEYQGDKYAVRLTKDGILENYSIEE